MQKMRTTTMSMNEVGKEVAWCVWLYYTDVDLLQT